MTKIVTVAEMRRLEQKTMRLKDEGHADGRSGIEMMERAGMEAARTLLNWTDSWPKEQKLRYAVLAGKGNNGGDAWVVARCLWEWRQESVVVYSLVPRQTLSGAAAYHAALLPRDVMVVEGSDDLPSDALASGTVVVDGLLGTGVHGPLHGAVRTWICQVNQSHCPVLSLDVPSGMDADTGEGEDAMVADLTVTMGFPKRGFFEGRGPAVCGVLQVVPIGFSSARADEARADGLAFDMEAARKVTERRRSDGYKGTFGHVLCLGGSLAYCGAPALCACGAVRAGAGLVTLAVPEACQTVPPLNSIIFRKVGKQGTEHFSKDVTERLNGMLAGKQAIAFGPGIGDNAAPEVLQLLMGSGLPLVLDADALRLLARNPELMAFRRGQTVLTPHVGEMKALSESFGMPTDFMSTDEQARWLARKTGCVVVLKGRFTRVASPDGNVTVNMSGCVSLATAGSGDVLTGVIAALLGNGLEAPAAARLGVFLHGLAGESWKGARRSMAADDLPMLLNEAWKKIAPWT